MYYPRRATDFRPEAHSERPGKNLIFFYIAGKNLLRKSFGPLGNRLANSPRPKDFSAIGRDGHNTFQNRTAHRKTGCLYSGITDQGEPKSPDRNGYRRTHDINKPAIEGLAKYRVFENIDVFC
jgi:hypothetical protein